MLFTFGDILRCAMCRCNVYCENFDDNVHGETYVVARGGTYEVHGSEAHRGPFDANDIVSKPCPGQPLCPLARLKLKYNLYIKPTR